MFDRAIIDAAKAHALAEYPKEACGFVIGSRYLSVWNCATHPTEHFQMPAGAWVDAEADFGPILAVIHSHTRGQDCPSEADMRGQIATAVPWGVIVTNGEVAREPFWWGDGVPIPPLIGRQFRHGVTDCYSIIRDWYRLERGVTLPEFPRSDEWWSRGGNLYEEGFGPAGFACIATGPQPPELQAGDVALIAIRRGCPAHHAGIYLGDGLMLHHFADTGAKARLSKRDPIGPWCRYVTHWLRYAG